MYFSFKFHRSLSLGFGLIELMVSITIIAMVSAIVIAKHNSFNGAVLLRNQAYEVAFAIRQAQLLAVSGINPNTTITQQYGVYFSKSNPNAFIIFRDEDTVDGRYDPAIDTQIGSIGIIDKRFEIRDIFYSGGTTVGNGTHNNISVSFVRPNFDALFRRTTGGYVSGSIYIDIARVGESGNGIGDVRRVEITNTGQIAVTEY